MRDYFRERERIYCLSKGAPIPIEAERRRFAPAQVLQNEQNDDDVA